MKRRQLLLMILILATVLAGMLAFAAMQTAQPQDPTLQTGSTVPSTTTQPSTQPPTTVPTQPPTTAPTEPPIVKETTATIGATGDILLHDRVIRSGYNWATDSFDYRYMFAHFGKYASAVDYAAANLEVTLIQRADGSGLKGYNGYPRFNSPDEIVDALKDAGFDLLLTANNHSYDTGHDGFHRTQQVIADKGLTHIGTRPAPEDKPYKIVNVNGISIGMINYTYNTGEEADGSVSLNVHPLSAADSALVNSYSYGALDKFYAQLQTQLDAMRAEGAEATVLYIHWGDEYKTSPNATQKSMAQKLCDMGIDVIVGNHAHVPQPVELLTSAADPSKKTLCLYSTGNSVSNISRDDRRPKNTEDGMLFSFTFARYSDGTVVVESAHILPTWVWRYKDAEGTQKFLILTLDEEIEDWKTELNISDSVLAECRDSYDRTMGIVGSGLEEANKYFAQHQAEVEALLGIH